MRRLGISPKVTDIDNKVPAINDWFETATSRFNIYQLNADPTATDIPPNQWVVVKNTTTGTLKLWANDNGTVKSVTLT